MKVSELIAILEKCNPDDDLQILSSLNVLFVGLGTSRKKEIVINSPRPQGPSTLSDWDKLWHDYIKMAWGQRYRIYLESERWKAKRKKIFERDDFICQSCLVAEAEQVHHLSYDRAGNEPLFDLISVCTECHEKITRDTRINQRKFRNRHVFGSFLDYFLFKTGQSEDDLEDLQDSIPLDLPETRRDLS